MGLNHGWDEFDKSQHADFVRGGVKPSDFEYVTRWPKNSQKKRRPKRGCPENNYKEHVYVWETRKVRVSDGSLFTWEVKLCCGCEKVYTRRLCR